MQIQVKGSVSLLAGIQPKIRNVVLKETANIQGCWKKTVENLLDIGHSLDKIKEMLPHPIFLAHIKASLGLGEMQGIPDNIAYAGCFDLDATPYFTEAKKYSYNKTVFLLAPWQEIYTTDDERSL